MPASTANSKVLPTTRAYLSTRWFAAKGSVKHWSDKEPEGSPNSCQFWNKAVSVKVWYARCSCSSSVFCRSDLGNYLFESLRRLKAASTDWVLKLPSSTRCKVE